MRHSLSAFFTFILLLAFWANQPARAESLSAYGRGKKALEEKVPHEAELEFRQCLRETPERTECHWELGWASFLQNQFQRALKEWKWVQRKKPDYPMLKQALEKAEYHTELMKKARILKTQVARTYWKKSKQKSPRRMTLRIRAVGDTMLGTNYPYSQLPPAGLNLLEEVTPQLSGADITFANWEGTFCEGGETEKCPSHTESNSCFAFRSPPSFASFLVNAGFDVVSIANNHIMDFGETCRDQTEETLTTKNILWSGKQGSVARFERNGIPISFIAFHSASHTNSTLDLPQAVALIEKEKKGNRLVIVSFHGGAEGYHALHVPKKQELFFNEKRGNLPEFSHAVIDAGADLVLGSGPHVLRAMEVYRDRLIAYSLGNFATYKVFNLSGLNGVGAILEVELSTKGEFRNGRIIPTKQKGFGVPILDPDRIAVDLIRLLSQEDFPDSGVQVARDGTVRKRKQR